MKKEIKEWINNIQNTNNKEKILKIYNIIIDNFKKIEPCIKWNQLFFLDNKKFIIAIASYKNHISVAIDKQIMDQISDTTLSIYEKTNYLFKIKANDDIDKKTIIDLINKSLNKKNSNKFW